MIKTIALGLAGAFAFALTLLPLDAAAGWRGHGWGHHHGWGQHHGWQHRGRGHHYGWHRGHHRGWHHRGW